MVLTAIGDVTYCFVYSFLRTQEPTETKLRWMKTMTGLQVDDYDVIQNALENFTEEGEKCDWSVGINQRGVFKRLANEHCAAKLPESRKVSQNQACCVKPWQDGWMVTM